MSYMEFLGIWKDYKKGIAWYVVVFLGLMTEWYVIKSALGIEYANSFGTILKCIGDVALLLLPYWLLTSRWRWTAFLPILLVSLWGICNFAYFRFWGELIPPAWFLMGRNVDSEFFKYGISLLRLNDMFFLIIVLMVLMVYFYMKPGKGRNFSKRIKLLGIIFSLGLGLAGQASYFKTATSWRNSLVTESLSERLKDHYLRGNITQLTQYQYGGLALYSIRFMIDSADVLNSRANLSTEERKEINDFLKSYSGQIRKGSFDVDTMNVVYIIVESLNADMVGKTIGGRKVMPVLDSLARMKGTVVFDNVVSQIKASSSSDGHLLLMTGLLPPKRISYSLTFGTQNKYPSLADVLPSHCKYLLLADDGVCWNEGNTLRNFGLGEPLAIKDRPGVSIEKHGHDGAMFMQAIEIIKQAQRPFFMTLMTISMHIPFKEDAWPRPEWLENTPGLPQLEKDYANTCLNTDRYIGDFIAELPSNTIVFIASDHNQKIAADGSSRAYYMAVNAGRSERVSRIVGQINLFPATLEILGKSTGYGGLAPSAFNPCVDGTVDSYGNVYGNPTQEVIDTLTKAMHISDMIIRGDFFDIED